jgi:cyclopropane fatty-acyl-phospholipid synthase-like methyltransferase
MYDFYEAFYKVVEHSAAHAEFCRRVFGRNLCQHGFADMEQVDALIATLDLQPGKQVLELGCGNGMVAEYIADQTGAHITGIDYSPQGVEQARRRTTDKREHLTFAVGDLNTLELPAATYDAIISIDSIYFSNDYTRTVREWRAALRPGGKLVLLYAYGREPWVAKEAFPAENLAPERTPLAAALIANGLRFTTQNFTAQDHALAVRRTAVLDDLRPQFEAEEFLFIWENRCGDAQGVRQAIEEGLHARYLYRAET